MNHGFWTSPFPSVSVLVVVKRSKISLVLEGGKKTHKKKERKKQERGTPRDQRMLVSPTVCSEDTCVKKPDVTKAHNFYPSLYQ